MPARGTIGTLNANSTIFPYSPSQAQPGAGHNQDAGTLQAGGTVQYLGDGGMYDGHRWSHVALTANTPIVFSQNNPWAAGGALSTARKPNVPTDGWIWDEYVNWDTSAPARSARGAASSPKRGTVRNGGWQTFNGSIWQDTIPVGAKYGDPHLPRGYSDPAAGYAPGTVFNGHSWVPAAPPGVSAPAGPSGWRVSGSPPHAYHPRTGKDLGMLVGGANGTQTVQSTDGGRKWGLWNLLPQEPYRSFVNSYDSIPGVPPPPTAQAAGAPPPPPAYPQPSYPQGYPPPGYPYPGYGPSAPPPAYPYPVAPTPYPVTPVAYPYPPVAAPSPPPPGSYPSYALPPGYTLDPMSGLPVAMPLLPMPPSAPLAGTPGTPSYDPVTGQLLTAAQAAYQGAAYGVEQVAAQQAAQAQADAAQQAAQYQAMGLVFDPASGNWVQPNMGPQMGGYSGMQPGYGPSQSTSGLDPLTASIMGGGGCYDASCLAGMSGGLDASTLALLSGGDPEGALEMAMSNGGYDPTASMGPPENAVPYQ